MNVLETLNEGVRFLLELCALAALAYWGFQTGNSTATKVVLGLGAPVVAAVIWATLVAPGASARLGDPARLVVEVVVFGGAVAALALAGRPVLAGVLAAVVAANIALLFAFGQR